MTICSKKEGMFESQTASVMCLACGERETEREGEMAHPRAQHPSRHYGRAQCVAGFTNVCYISMKGDGGRFGRKGVGGGRGGDPPHIGRRTREKISLDLTYGVNIVSEMK